LPQKEESKKLPEEGGSLVNLGHHSPEEKEQKKITTNREKIAYSNGR